MIESRRLNNRSPGPFTHCSESVTSLAAEEDSDVELELLLEVLLTALGASGGESPRRWRFLRRRPGQ